MVRREDPAAPAFSWDEVPAEMHEVAVRGMAVAYLLDTWGGITREHVGERRAS